MTIAEGHVRRRSPHLVLVYDRDARHRLGKRLLMVSTVPITLQGFLLPIVQRMRAKGWRVDGAAHGISASEPCTEAFDRVWDVQWSRNPLHPGNLFRATSRIRQIVAEGGYDVVHVHTPVAAFVTRIALAGMRRNHECQVIYTAHGFHFHERNGSLRNAAFLALEKLAGRWTDQLVLINEYDVEQALRHHIVGPERVRYMHGIGIDIARFDPASIDPEEAHALREILGVADGQTLLLVPAEFIPRKRQDLIVEALQLTGRSDIHVAFVGTGPTMGEVRGLAEERGVIDRTHFLGWRDDLALLYKSANATVLYSQQEGLSRAVMESLAMRCPVIGADIRGIRELVSDGCGIAVDPDRVDLLAEAMTVLADDPELAAKMGRSGREKMAGPYEQRHIVAEHEVMYEHVYASV